MQAKTYLFSFIITTLAVVVVAVFFALFAAPAAQGQEQTEQTERATIEEEESIKPIRLELQASQSNVCDGVTCADGSCAATIDECSAVPAADVTTCAVDTPYRCQDGSCRKSATACPAVGTDDDGAATAGDEHEVEYDILKGASGGEPEDPVDDIRDADDDGDGISTDSERGAAEGDSNAEATSSTDRAQNHNSSRSNRTEGVAVDWLDPDDDGDGVPEVALRSAGFIKLGGVDGDPDQNRAQSGEVVCWGRAEDEAGNEYAWGRGLCVALEATEGASATATDRIAALQVRGDDVRSWSEEERAAWREYRAERGTTSPEENLAAHLVEKVQENERIIEMRVDDDEPSDDVSFNYSPIEVRYSAEVRLFGLIPLEREVAARIDGEGNTSVDYPWYRFMSTVPENDRIESLLQDTLDILVLVPGRG